METCPSGRRGSPAKGVWGQKLHRGFESLSLRHLRASALRHCVRPGREQRSALRSCRVPPMRDLNWVSKLGYTARPLIGR